jgi:hypothetical protein
VAAPDFYVIDADPTSPTLNQVVDDIPTGIASASKLSCSYAERPICLYYDNELDNSGKSNFVVMMASAPTLTRHPP